MLNIEKYKDEILNEYQQLTNKTLTNKIPPNHSDGTRMNKAIKAIAFKHCEKRLLGASGPFKWLCEEYREPILDEEEKAYLSTVIEPFRKKIAYIVKLQDFIEKKQFIKIVLQNDDRMCFPYFDYDSMYNGMETNKHYSLEELGL